MEQEKVLLIYQILSRFTNRAQICCNSWGRKPPPNEQIYRKAQATAHVGI